MLIKIKGKRYRLRPIIAQRLIGIALLIISALVILVASNGNTIEDRDATAVLMFAPLGLWLLFSKKQIIE